MIIYGLCLLALVFLFPKGLAPLIDRFWSFCSEEREMTASAASSKSPDCNKSYGAVRAVDDVSLHVDRGEICGLIGPNGSGKSTFFDCATGLAKPNAGTVRLDGQDITGWSLQPHRPRGPHAALLPEDRGVRRARRRGEPGHRRPDVHLSGPLLDLRRSGLRRATASRRCANGRASSSRSPGSGTCAHLPAGQPVRRPAEAHPVRLHADAGARS